MGGRLRNSLRDSVRCKTPCHFVNCVNCYRHAGLNVLIGIVRQSYLIIRAKKIIKNYIHKGVTCCSYKAVSSKQLMGDRHLNRIFITGSFLHVDCVVCGIDCVRSINILTHRVKRVKTAKCYIVLFVCFTTKAVHLELVSDLIPKAFIDFILIIP